MVHIGHMSCSSCQLDHGNLANRNTLLLMPLSSLPLGDQQWSLRAFPSAVPPVCTEGLVTADVRCHSGNSERCDVTFHLLWMLIPIVGTIIT